ncbi:hypothetical protein [Actinoplanes aureus]|uniref:Uncharacterized protein n=1 Tax=Actinoplanes aureus TaxID=2792083 RepID=A0A931G331_9ACTN|nr:hypothetical protein [Actinoplanes aureus]MBG0563879.1 hypothetical protein [Actinoplanes aureus]
MPNEDPPLADWRLEELRRLGDVERRLSLELADTREAIVQMIGQVLPQHAKPTQIEQVVQASGYSRWMIERLRDGKMW